MLKDVETNARDIGHDVAINSSLRPRLSLKSKANSAIRAAARDAARRNWCTAGRTDGNRWR